VKQAKCFAEEAARFGAYSTVDAGPRVIELARVTGTVNKCGQLRSDFRLLHLRRDRKERYRRLRLDQADLQLEILPPIDVYLLAGEYYVIDGNRRVASAKLQRLEYMDARVTECLPLADREALEGAVLRRRFEQETGLRNLRLSYEHGYGILLREVNGFIPEAGVIGELRERARSWHSRFFLPACGLIRQSPLPSAFPRAGEADLYVMIAGFYQELMGGYPPKISYESLLSGFLFARSLKSRRLLRRPPMRLLYRLLQGRQA
jgi:hypothetical protein